MEAKTAKPFAQYGCEKMIYDVRMGPMAVHSEDVIYAVYQANPDGPEAHPHIITYDVQRKIWSDPVQVGTVKHYDHHYAPIVWLDHEKHIHVLFNCHGGQHSAIHLVSTAPGPMEKWREAPEIAPSITYPRAVRVYDDKLLLFYRSPGHMGYWTYQISEDGASWKMSQRIEPARGLLYNNPRPVEDMDGSEMDYLLLFYGWEGPGSIQPNDSASGVSGLRGKAYLWNDGTWL